MQRAPICFTLDGELITEPGKNSSSKEVKDGTSESGTKTATQDVLVKAAPIYPTAEGFNALKEGIRMIVSNFEAEQEEEQKRLKNSTMEEGDHDGTIYEDPDTQKTKLGMTEQLYDSVAHGDCKCPKCLDIIIDYIQEELKRFCKRQNRFDEALDQMFERYMICLRSINAILPYEESPL